LAAAISIAHVDNAATIADDSLTATWPSHVNPGATCHLLVVGAFFILKISLRHHFILHIILPITFKQASRCKKGTTSRDNSQ